MTPKVELWPGGIPSFIRPPSNPSSIELEDIPVIAKGWHRFVQENWASSIGDNDDDKARQRRSLITTWVSAEQDFRDSYTDKAPDSEPPFEFEELATYGCNSTSSVWNCYLITDVPQSSTKWALWLKLILLFFDFRNAQNVAPDRFVMTPRENDTITLDNFKRYEILEPANYQFLKFNNLGQVLFDWFECPSMLVDERALNTGMVLVATFDVDGTPNLALRVRPLDLFDPFMRMEGLGKDFESSIESLENANDLEDERVWVSHPDGMDMKQPLVDIIFSHTESTETPLGPYWGREKVKRLLHERAPGYLEAEEQGNGLAKDYDLSCVKFGF